jgi:hypothetical protein
MTDYTRPWGNPGGKTFRKRFIRRMNARGVTTEIHAELVDVATALITEAADAGIELPATLRGWQPAGTAKLEAANYGIALEAVPGLAAFALRWRFVEDDGWLVFTGDIEKAKIMAETAETKRVLKHVQEEQPPDTLWTSVRPGERELTVGDRGDDVQFFQMVFNAPEQSGIFDQWCEGLAGHLQGRWGIEKTGTVTDDLWRGILPNVYNYQINYGDSGHMVRVLQAALYAYDWDGGNDVVVNGRFDEATMRAVKNLQETYGLRQHPGMTGAEWAALLGVEPGGR